MVTIQRNYIPTKDDVTDHQTTIFEIDNDQLIIEKFVNQDGIYTQKQLALCLHFINSNRIKNQG